MDIRPDLIWEIGERVLAVIDAKYKAEMCRACYKPISTRRSRTRLRTVSLGRT